MPHSVWSKKSSAELRLQKETSRNVKNVSATIVNEDFMNILEFASVVPYRQHSILYKLSYLNSYVLFGIDTNIKTQRRQYEDHNTPLGYYTDKD